MYQHHRQMTHTCLALRQWLSSLEGPPIPHQALLQAKTEPQNPHFSKQCFIVSLVICSNA